MSFGHDNGSIWQRHMLERRTLRHLQNRSYRPRLNVPAPPPVWDAQPLDGAVITPCMQRHGPQKRLGRRCRSRSISLTSSPRGVWPRSPGNRPPAAPARASPRFAAVIEGRTADLRRACRRMIKPALSDLFTRPPTHARPAALSLEKEMRSMLPSAASVAGAAAALSTRSSKPRVFGPPPSRPLRWRAGKQCRYLCF